MNNFIFHCLCVCAVVDCGTLEDPANGQVDTSGGTTFGSLANYTCDASFILLGVTTRMCQADEQWSGDEPTCGKCMAPK